MPKSPLIVPTEYPVAGVDEVGRGPLAGPVVAAAVVLPVDFDPIGLGDSKALTLEQREKAEIRIKSESIWSITFIEPDVIDRINILQATFEAMRRALAELAVEPVSAVIDGDKVPSGLRCPATSLIKGDARHASISAASIIAKCARDRFMAEQAERFPEYGFDRHFGYGTPEHLDAIRKYGPCPIHRMSFAPLRPEPQLCLALDD